MSPLLKTAERSVRKGIISILSRLVRRTSPAPYPKDLRNARILLIRQDRIGDVLVSTPFIAALHRNLPDATIDMLVSTNNAVVTDGIPQVRHRWTYTKSLFPSVRLIRKIREQQYDVAVDLMDNPSATSTLFCLLAGARWTIGIEKANEYVYDVKVPLLSRKDVHIVRRIAELLRPFGVDPDREPLRIGFDPPALADTAAHRLLVEHGIREHQAVCVNISAGSSSREWSAENFGKLAVGLERTYPDRDVLVACSPAQEARARDIIRHTDRTRLLPPTNDFLVFAALVRRMGFIVTPDTAVVHLAAAFQVPCVVMFIQTDKDLRIWDPYDVPHRSIVSDVDSLSGIAPQRVLEAVGELLPPGKPERRGQPAKKA